MKIVIDIPESMYEGVMIDRVLDTTVIRILNEIKNGTVLPKGHGRLIDADALLKSHLTSDYDCRITRSGVESAQTIIEADEAEKGQ